MRRFIIVLAILAVIATVIGVVNLRRNADAYGVDWRIKKRLPTKEVQLERPRRAEIVETVTAPGTIELIDEADIASEMVGKVEEVCVEKGDSVKKGELLVRLDDEDATARLESTEARIERLEAAIAFAQADLTKAKRDWEGYKELREKSFSTPSEVLEAETIHAKMEAALEMSQHELEESFAARRNSRQDLERTQIRSPIDGTVIDLDVEVGEVVIAGTTNLPGTVLMTIGDMSRMRVRADVDETDVRFVKSGQPTKIFLQANQEDPISGEVALIAPKGSKVAEVVSFETLIDVTGKTDTLRPEMTATVEIEVQRAQNALSVPVQAVVHRRAKDLPKTDLFKDWLASRPQTPSEKGKDPLMRFAKIVFVMENGIARAKPVETGISDQQRIAILKGLTEDADVIIGPFRTLDEMGDGQPVKLEEPEDESKSDEKKGSK
jgi:HlyD family secretion protein